MPLILRKREKEDLAEAQPRQVSGDAAQKEMCL